MRLLITTGIFPPDIGGPATFVSKVVAALRERGHAVTVLTLGEEGAAAGMWPFPVVRLPRRLPLPVRVPLATSQIVSAARAADVIFANGLFEETAAAALVTRRSWAAKVVGDWVWERARNQGWTRQEIESFQTVPPARARLHRLAQRVAIRRARRVIVPSAFLGRLVERWGVRSGRIHVVPNAVELPPAPLPERAAAKRRLGLGEAVVLSVGRLVSWKRVDGLLLASAGQPWEVVVVGDGPERARLEKMAADLGRQARFTGAQSGSALADHFAAADIFVLNSTYEGFPHVALEAMAAGVPVIAAAAGGTPEVVLPGRTGVLVPPGDDRALRAAIAALLADSERRVRLTEGGREVAARFTWKAQVEQLVPLLERLPVPAAATA
ncbi:MAG: glycosyltransferase family 4 protein [Gemmatimonadales bacterium]